MVHPFHVKVLDAARCKSPFSNTILDIFFIGFRLSIFYSDKHETNWAQVITTYTDSIAVHKSLMHFLIKQFK